VESKSGRIRRVKQWESTLAVLALLSASLALADDFRTISGKEYKNVTVSRIESDGIVLKSKSGITKVYFTELPKDVQERFIMIPRKVRISPPTERQRLHSKMRRSQSIVLAEPLINSSPSTERHKIRPVSTRIPPCCRERFITLMTIKAGESAPHFSHRTVLPFEWHSECEGRIRILHRRLRQLVCRFTSR